MLKNTFFIASSVVVTSLAFVEQSHATELASNLNNVSSGVEVAVGNDVLCAAFKTDASAHTLYTVMLSLARVTSTGSATVSIYSSRTLEPNAPIATLSLASAYASVPTATSFTSSTGVTLAANATYWVVLRADSGQFAWAWTPTANGNGAGFDPQWGKSTDLGQFWWTQNIYPVQMRVVVDEPPAAVCDSIDFNNDTSLFDPQDIDAFLSVYSEGPCIPVTATCNDIDFNNDGSVFDPCDIDSFLLQFSEGPCTPCAL